MDWLSQYVGIPYLKGGDTIDGSDCWGLFNLVHRVQFGRALPPYEGPLWQAAATDKRALGSAAMAYASNFVPVAWGEERLGDGMLWSLGRYPTHLSMVIEPGRMLHIEEGCDSVIERYPSMLWPQRRIAGLYRYV